MRWHKLILLAGLSTLVAGPVVPTQADNPTSQMKYAVINGTQDLQYAVISGQQKLADQERRIAALELQLKDIAKDQNLQDVQVALLRESMENLESSNKLIVGLLISLLVAFMARVVYDVLTARSSESVYHRRDEEHASEPRESDEKPEHRH
jgi:hypothetical protein